MGNKETLTRKFLKLSFLKRKKLSHALLEAGSRTSGPLSFKNKSGADPTRYSSRYKE
jgi:hypothetical protein